MRSDRRQSFRLCFADPAGNPLRQAAVHRELQVFLDAHPRGLVALPRDHGKSVQIGVRLVWELGRRPGLRIKIVCATEALAAERGRFIRDSIAANPLVRLVFPHLAAARPWEVVRFAIERPATTSGQASPPLESTCTRPARGPTSSCATTSSMSPRCAASPIASGSSGIFARTW